MSAMRRLVHDAGFWCECAEVDCDFNDPQGPCFAKLDQRNGERRVDRPWAESITRDGRSIPGLDKRVANFDRRD